MNEEILELLGEGVVVVEQGLIVRYANFMAGKMLGLSRKEMLGKTLASIAERTKKPVIERCSQLLQSCQRENGVVTDSFSFSDGKKLYLDLIAAPKVAENGVILILQDKSNQQRVLEMGKDFVANASHELRTPITIIRGFAETLQDLPEISAEMLRDIMDKILRSCLRMDNLVKNLLTLADIENLPLMNLQSCALDQLVEDCKKNLMAAHPEAQVEVEIERPSMAFVARDLLELAIFNLLENAVKYSSVKAHITICLQKMGRVAKISIQDRGIGIPEADLEYIFQRFYTVNKAHSRKLGGAGLGLSIVKTIIDKHEGKISVVSEMGRGTCFTIEIPLNCDE